MEVDWTGVTKNIRYEMLLSKAYKEMVDAEDSVKFATTWIFVALRNYHFFSIEEA